MLADAQRDDIGYDPFDVKVMSNPLPYYERLRREQPIYFTAKYDTYWLSRFDDIVEMLKVSPDILISSESSIPMPEVLLKHHDSQPPKAALNPMSPMVLLHNPHYMEIRFAHMAAFRPAAVAKMESFIRSRSVELLEKHLPEKRFDLFLQVSGLVSALLTCELFGIDPAQAPDILTTVNSITTYDPERGGIDNSLFFSELKRFMVPAIARRRAQGADGSDPIYDGLLTYRTKPDDRLLTDDEIADQLACAFIANTETPGKVAAQGLMELFKRPEQLAAVRSDLRKNATTATEEMLRYSIPNQWVLRTAHQDVVINGVEIKMGQRVAGLLACANRDEREFENPNEFIWNRPFKRQLSFGMGLKHCMGLHIARLQIRVVVEEYLKRVKACIFHVEDAVLRPSYFHWAYASLPVEVTELM